MWWLYAVLCAFLWACGYTVLNKLANDLNQFTIDVIYGVAMTIINFLILVFTNQMDNFLVLYEKPNQFGWLLLYTTIFLVASFVSMSGFLQASQAGMSNGFIAVSSIYPLITFGLSYVFLNQTNIEWKLAIPGILLGIASVTLISFSKKETTSSSTG